ncbi:SGNH hydrolase-type esterase domain-containing protein [Coniochaeta sp. 2T2.1]|nr:SGNH hydrolase-type esterase domain-containing protein [Coniochaeta sp. 2T2.1]
MAPREPPTKKIRILCFGDSLTAGYSRMGSVYHPYSEKLVQMVEMAFPEYEVESVEDGVPGDLVSGRGTFLSRMERQFAKDDPNKAPYDWTIILGGTNDIAWGTDPETIFSSLLATYSIPLSASPPSKVLALTIPEAGIPPGPTRDRVEAKRNQVNSLIKSHRSPNYHVFDLEAAVPYWKMEEVDRKKYWDDHIHFTSQGYDLIGKKVGMALVSLLVKDKIGKETEKKRRRNFRDDDGMFEEEGGDPNSLDQGYIVVRRKDLE